MSPRDALIEIRGLSFTYPATAVRALTDLTLDIEAGSIFGLLGPNGSGKTTLISILCGLLPVQTGDARVGGHSLRTDPRAAQLSAGLVPQEYAFYPTLTVEENLSFFAGVQGIAGRERVERLAEVRAVAGLERSSGRRAAALSGGMKRRLNLAIGLLARPRVLFLDEPTVGIDPQSRVFILDAIRQINQRGTTVVYASHYMEEVEDLCDRIAVLDDGRLLVQGSLAQLLTHAGGRRLRVDLADPLTDVQRAQLARFTRLRVDRASLAMEDCEDAEFGELMQALSSSGADMTRVRFGEATLEELFLTLTHRALRDS